MSIKPIALVGATVAAISAAAASAAPVTASFHLTASLSTMLSTAPIRR